MEQGSIVMGKVESAEIGQLRWLQQLVVFAALVTPSFVIGADMPRLRIDDLLLLVAPILVIHWIGRLVFDARAGILALIAVIVVVGTFSGMYVGLPGSAGDLFYLLRVGKYAGAVFLGSALVASAACPRCELTRLMKWVVFCLLLSGAVCVQQYFNLLGLNEHYVRYVAPTQFVTLVDNYGWPRPVGMMGNPNDLGMSYVIGALCSLWLFVTIERLEIRWLLAAGAFAVLTLLTLSRGAMIAGVAGGGVLLLSLWIHGILRDEGVGETAGKRVVAIVAVLCGFVVVLSMIPAVEERFLWRYALDNTAGFEQRVENWAVNLSLWERSPFFGVGTLQRAGIIKHGADNEWLHLLRIGGPMLVLAVVCLFCAWLIPSKRKIGWGTNGLVAAITVACFVFMVPAAVFNNLSLMPIVLLIVIAATGVRRVKWEGKPRPGRVTDHEREVLRNGSEMR